MTELAILPLMDRGFFNCPIPSVAVRGDTDVLLISTCRTTTTNSAPQAIIAVLILSALLEIARLFQSYFMGGFEGSSHRRRDGRQLDLLAMTRHDELVELDYRMVPVVGSKLSVMHFAGI
jgi:hypothetical protein